MDAKFLRDCFDYDSLTGSLIWKIRPRNHFKTVRGWRQRNGRFAGKRAGARTTNGYICIGIDGALYYAHRLIWCFITGTDPQFQIDHVNRDRSDNRFENLREATQILNSANMKRRDRGLPKGVHAPKSRVNKNNPFVAMIHINGRTRYLGVFPTPQAASAAYEHAANQEWGGYHLV